MDRLSQTEFLKKVREKADAAKRLIEAEVDGFSTNPAESARRVSRAKDDLRFFAKTYFPHYVTGPESVLHTWLYKNLPEKCSRNLGTRLAVAAPRGEAKSTLVTQIFTLWCVVTGRKRFIPIIMDAQHQAWGMLEAIKAELEINPRLAQDFPKACGEGRLWQMGHIVTNNNACIMAFGSGVRMRGLRHGPHRPDLVICDDLENDENVRSRTQRDKSDVWLNKTVLKLGPPDGSMDVVYVGTLLHHDSVLARVMGNALWESRKFKAVIEWPERTDLWDRWEEVLREDGVEAADAFYVERQDEMERGAVVSWPGVRTLEKLMKIRFSEGRISFDSELQNEPGQEDAAFGEIQTWDGDPDPAWSFFGSVDPSMGKSGSRGDPSAILVGGYDHTTGVLYVIDADIRIRQPDQIINDVIGLQSLRRCRVWGVETVQFQEFFKDELVRQSTAAGMPVPAQGVKHTSDKVMRIQGLQPHIKNGVIRIHSRLRTLLDQLRHWGEPDAHDDGPDALEMLATISPFGGVKWEKPKGTGATDVNRLLQSARQSAPVKTHRGGFGGIRAALTRLTGF